MDGQLGQGEGGLASDVLAGNEISPPELRRELPYTWVETMKILGLFFDEEVTFKEHMAILVTKLY